MRYKRRESSGDLPLVQAKASQQEVSSVSGELILSQPGDAIAE
jgi:hypothetical protein